MEELSDYLSSRHEPENINARHKESLTLHERIALISTNLIGTMYAVYLILIFIGGWMLWQSYFTQKPFDPYPFAFLLFIGSIIQLPLMSLIMVGQNLQGRHSEFRAEEEYKATSLMYKDMGKLLFHISSQEKTIKELSDKIEQLKKV